MKLSAIFYISLAMFFLIFALPASANTSKSDCEKIMIEESFLKISEKIIVFLKNNPSKNNLTIEDLQKEKAINDDDYNFY